MKKYHTTGRCLLKYLSKVSKADDIYLKQLNYRFIGEFEQFLRAFRNPKKELVRSNNGIIKHLKRFKKMGNLAVKLLWFPKNPFNQFQLKYNKFDRQFLA
ncbi:phage integrase SAM-like domain-containing protein [Subsaximicrobium wynnwilliamsii]|nr:phage integrase SAM-like domain-containing protein [Subsaximicrobium wynnwilliamsii]